jgi:hypothetical protein
MPEHDHDFDLVQLDRQIEHPYDSLNAKAQQLVKDLQHIGQPSDHEIRANAQSLQRVQMRLQDHLNTVSQKSATPSFHLLQTQTHSERNTSMHIPTRRRQQSWQHFSHAINTLAAILIVAVLISCVAMLIMWKSHLPITRLNTTTGASVHTTTTFSKLDCSQIFTQDNGSYPDNGEHAVCLQGAETPLHGTANINGHTLVLLSAYADTNRLLLKYVVSGRVLDRYDGGPAISQILIQDTKQTIQPDLASTWSIGGGYNYNAQKHQTSFLSSFSTQQVASGITTLKVTVDFSATTGATTVNPAGTGASTASFVFTVPLHTQQRVATPNQSLILNGHHLTLTKVVVTPSATVLSIQTDKPLIPSTTSHVAEAPPFATINGDSNVSGTFTTNGNVNGKWDAITGISFGAAENWLSQPTTWTMTLRSVAQPLGKGTGTMRFIVPR